MNKIVKLLMASMMIVTVASSDINYRVGVGNATINDLPSFSAYTIGMGIEGFSGKHLHSGFTFDMEFASLEERGQKSLGTFAISTDYHLGYAFKHKFIPYALVGLKIHRIDGIDSSAIGFGYGAGVEYKFTPKWSVLTEYKTYSVKNYTTDFNYDSASTIFMIKYSFKPKKSEKQL